MRQPTRGELLRTQCFGELPGVMSIVAFLSPSAERMAGGALRSGFDDFKRHGRQRADQVADLASLAVFFGDRRLNEGIGHQVAFQRRLGLYVKTRF